MTLGRSQERDRKTKVIPPGPGAHNPPSHFLGRHPASNVPGAAAYSMPSGRKEHSSRQDRGEIGRYNPEAAVHATEVKSAGQQGFGFSIQKRLLTTKGTQSGDGATIAGQQDSMKFDRAPQHGFGSEVRVLRIPGAVQSDSTEKATEEARKSRLPGPGHHNPNDEATSKYRTSTSFTASPRRVHQSTPAQYTGPGPGSYNFYPDNLSTYQSPPRFAASLARRRGTESSSLDCPGPGTYSKHKEVNRRGGYCEMGLADIKGSISGWSMPGRRAFNLVPTF